MEQSKEVDYNEKAQEGVTHDPPDDTHTTYAQHGIQTQQGFVNSGFQPDFNQQPGFVTQLQQPTTARVFTQQNTNDSYCDRLFRNRRQTGSIAGALLLMLNSGLHIGWGIWRAIFLGLSVSVGLLTFMIMSWSLGAFFGGFFGSIITPIIKKDVVYYISAGAMLFGNLLFIIWDADNESIIVGRLLIGAAHGMAYVALITQAGENAAKNMRGTILSTINCMLYFGIFASVATTGSVEYTWIGTPVTLSGERIIGIIGVLLAVASIACIIMMSVETIPFLLRRNDRFSAMINLKRLRNAPYETIELTQEMEEFDLMVTQDKQNSGNIFSNGNGKPLMLMIAMRLMVALTNNFLMNAHAIFYVFQMLVVHQTYQYRLVPLIVLAPRFAMSIIQIFYADVLKRKSHIFGSAILAGFVMILFGILWNTITVTSIDLIRTVATVYGVLWLIFQFACSIGMDQMQDVYLSEAFSTAKKPWSISFVTGIEHLFHIFMIGMFYNNDFYFLYGAEFNALIFVTGVAIIVFGLILVFILPETRNMSLKQAKNLFINRSIHMVSPFR